jgi:hypothetical protein
MPIKVYKDSSANSIFIQDANGAQFINSLLASVPTTTVTITDLAREIDIVSNADHTDFVDENDNPYTGTAQDVCNTLNALFQSSGTPSNNSPSITSPLTINSVQGNIINYELTADFGVGYEWDLSNVSGITTVEGNPRKLIGGASLSPGTYNIPVKAINYNGEDSKTVVLTVANPPFANTKSTKFDNQQWCGGNAGILQNVLGRTGNGSGSGDAWSVSFYFKVGGSSNQSQTILYYGSGDTVNGNHILIKYNGDNSSRRQVILRYGSNNNYLQFASPVGTIGQSNGWKHFLITYDGGTTGSSSGSINSYYGRFKMFVDGVQQTTINTNANYGNTTALSGINFRIGRYNNSGHMRSGCRIDELAIWDSDQSSNASTLYNSGTVLDYSSLTQAPLHWWRMGDGDTYPYIFDVGTQANLIHVMNNMTSSNFTNDVP